MKTRVEELGTGELEARLYKALRRAEDRNLPEAARLAKLRFAEVAWGELLKRARRGQGGAREAVGVGSA
jgi:hypothetical protein